MYTRGLFASATTTTITTTTINVRREKKLVQQKKIDTGAERRETIFKPTTPERFHKSKL